MANIKANKKNIIKIKKQNKRNRAIKSKIATSIKKLKIAIQDQNDQSFDYLKKAKSEIGNAVAKGVIHKKNGSRKTSRVETFFNKNQKTSN